MFQKGCTSSVVILLEFDVDDVPAQVLQWSDCRTCSGRSARVMHSMGGSEECAGTGCSHGISHGSEVK